MAEGFHVTGQQKAAVLALAAIAVVVWRAAVNFTDHKRDVKELQQTEASHFAQLKEENAELKAMLCGLPAIASQNRAACSLVRPLYVLDSSRQQ